MPDDTQQSAELTGKQDLAQALYLGGSAFALGTSPIFAAGGSYTVGSACHGGNLYAALQGSGTYEGTNRYSPPHPTALITGMLPGYGRPWPGTYATYRVMSAHPTLVLAGMVVMAPVIAGEWAVEATDDAPAAAKQYISDLLVPMRTRIVTEMLKGMVFGHRGFERVKWMHKGMWSLKRLKPLLPELTEIVVDASGHFAGLKQGSVAMAPDKAVIYTFDRDGDDYYGRSRHENCRRSWSNWLSDEDNAFRLGTKASSVIPYVGYPPGIGKDENGKEQSNYDAAVNVARGMSEGKAVVFPNLGNFELDDFARMPELAKTSLWHHGTIDMGNSGPAMMALLEQLKYRDILLVRGWCRPERAILEAQRGGSRADSESHGDFGVTDCDVIHQDITECVNEQVVDVELVDNFGEAARGTVRLRAVPLVDEKRVIDETLLDAVCNNPAALVELIERTDMEAWQDRVGLPKSKLKGPWDGLMLEDAAGGAGDGGGKTGGGGGAPPKKPGGADGANE